MSAVGVAGWVVFGIVEGAAQRVGLASLAAIVGIVGVSALWVSFCGSEARFDPGCAVSGVVVGALAGAMLRKQQ